MALAYRMDPQDGMVYLVCQGAIDDASFVATIAALLGEPAYRADMNILCDFRGVTTFDITSLGVRQVAGLVARHNHLQAQRKVSVVAPKPVVYGLARMYEALRGGSPTQVGVFRELEEARAWLGLPSEEE